MRKQIEAAIIGVQKAGTSSLYSYLLQHPDLTGHDDSIEFSYFLRDGEFKKSWNEIESNYFKNSDNNKTLIIKSAGVIFYDKALKRLHEYNPKTKIIIVIRNPIDRAYSGYLYAQWQGIENIKPFDKAINSGTERFENDISKGLCSYLERGYYDEQIKRVYNYFPKEQVKIILYDDLKLNAKNAIMEVFNFLNIDSIAEIDTEKKHNKAGKAKFPLLYKMMRGKSIGKNILKKITPGDKRRLLKKKALNLISVESQNKAMDLETRKKLIEHFKPHNDKLSSLISKDLTSWNK